MNALKMALLLILILFPIIIGSNVNSLDDSNCSNFEFIFARGSGQKLNDSDYKNYKSALEKYLKNEKNSFYELGEKKDGYPAISADFSVSLGAIVSAGESYKFGESVEKGVKELIAHIKTESKRCKNKKFILAGYSQGAVVVDKSLNYLNAEKIFYVANFGDPKLYLPEGKRACKNIGLSNYRIYVPDCNVEEGILDGLKPYQPFGYYNKLGVWCNQNDIMCGSSLNIANPIKAHMSYDSENGYEKFAKLLSEKITSKTEELKPTDARYSDSKKRDVAIIYDFSQMANAEFKESGKTIEDNLKARLVALSNHGTRVAIYNSYNLQSPSKNLEKKLDFTNDNLSKKIDKYNENNRHFFGYLFADVNNIFYSIREVIKTANWSTGAEKNIFVLVNSVHSNPNSEDGTNYKDIIDFAKKENVKISFLSTNGTEEDYRYQEMILETNGISIGRDYSKIALEKRKVKNLFSKTFEINKNSKYTLVVINGAVYGLSDKESITITNLNLLLENTISFVGYDETGKKKNVEIINLRSKMVKAPDTSSV